MKRIIAFWGVLTLCVMLCVAFAPAASAAKAAKKAPAAESQAKPKEKPSPEPLKIDAEGIDLQDHKSYPIAEGAARAILKGHDDFCEASVNAEMALRCYYEMLIDTKYGGRKKMSDAQFDAVESEIAVLLKDLAASAGRYARKIEFATLAMSGMEEEEKTYFAKLLSPFAATPALAKTKQFTDDLSMDQLEKLAKRLKELEKKAISFDWVTIRGYRRQVLRAIVERGTKEAKEMTAEGNLMRACEVGCALVAATGAVVSAGTGAYLAGLSTLTATSATSALLGGASFTMGVVGGGLGAVDAVVGAAETISDKEQGKRETMKNIALGFNVFSFVTGGGISNAFSDSGKAAADAAAKGEDAYLAAANSLWAKSDVLQMLIDVKTRLIDAKNPKKIKEDFKESKEKLEKAEKEISRERGKLEKAKAKMEKKLEKVSRELRDIGGGGGGG